MTDVIMPQMGESIAEGTIGVWLVEPGQRVQEGQAIVQVATDKADIDIPSPASGVIKDLIAKQGQTVKVGELIARIDEQAVPAEVAGPAGHPKRMEGLPAAEEMRTVPPKEEVKPPPEIERKPEAAPSEATGLAGFYSPAVMRLAVEKGVDVTKVKGTGHEGRVTKADVLAAAEGRAAPAAPAPPAPPKVPAKAPPESEEEALTTAGLTPEEEAAYFGPRPDERAPTPAVLAAETGAAAEAGFGTYRPPVYEKEEGDKEEPFSRLRRLIADHMVYSKRTSPHVTTVAEVDLDVIVGLRSREKDNFKAKMGFSLTYLPFVILAAIRAIKEFPLMNSVVQGDSVLTKKHINMGVAVDSERGLMVPVVKSAEDMTLAQLARAVNDLSIKVRDRKILPDELSGGTFTVSNPGRHGNLFGTPIISQPQVGILRMGEVVKRPVVIEADGEDAIAIRPMMFLALSYDHRVVDGLTANEFLHRVKEILEEGDFSV